MENPIDSFGAPSVGPARLVLIGVLAVAFVTDLRRGRIPNLLTYPAALAGIVLGAVAGGFAGALSSSGGLAFGFATFFLIYMAGGVRGGDVKLMAAIGALVGWPAVLAAMFHSILVGGFLAIAVMIWHGSLLSSLRNVFVSAATAVLPGFRRIPLDPGNSHAVPYGVALSVGTLWSLVEGWALFRGVPGG